MNCTFAFRATILLLLLFAAASSALADCPPKTTVSDTIYNADSSAASGRLVISWPTFLIGACQVVAGQTTVTIANGILNVALFPNDGATPAGTSYRVTYYLKSGRVTTEYWVVPTSPTPITLALVRTAAVPVPSVMFSQSQVTNLISDLAKKVELPPVCPSGKFLQATAAPPQLACVDGTAAPLAGTSLSGTVKTDVDEVDPRVYVKTTVDSLLAAKANLSHSHDAAALTSGVLDPVRLPAPTSTALGGVRSGTCTGTDKMTGITTAGAILCGADETGGGGGSLHKVNGTSIADNSVINFEDSATISWSNPSAGNLKSEISDSSITAAKLAVSSPTGTQISGLGDANLSAGSLSPDRIIGTAEVIANKGAAGGYAALDGSAKVVQDPASAQTTAAASKIPLADGTGKIADGWLSANVSLLGQAIDLTSETEGTLPPSRGGTGAINTAITARYLRGDGTNFVTSSVAAGGAGSCTNQFVRAINDNAAPTCTTVDTADLGANIITDAKLRQSAGLSVIGRATNTTGDVADITASTDGHVLRLSGTTLGFGTISGASFGSQSANAFFTAPDGSAGNPTFRVIVDADIPSAITRDSEWPSATATLTNKTLEVEATGNVLTTVEVKDLLAGGCDNATASASWDLPTSGAAGKACLGSGVRFGVLTFADGSTTAAFNHLRLPADWTSTGGLDITLLYTGDTSSTNNIRFQVSTACVADGEDLLSPTFNTASASNTAGPTTAGQRKSISFTGVNVSNCAAGETIFFKLERIGADGGDTYAGVGQALNASVRYRRAQ